MAPEASLIETKTSCGIRTPASVVTFFEHSIDAEAFLNSNPKANSRSGCSRNLCNFPIQPAFLEDSSLTFGSISRAPKPPKGGHVPRRASPVGLVRAHPAEALVELDVVAGHVMVRHRPPQHSLVEQPREVHAQEAPVCNCFPRYRPHKPGNIDEMLGSASKDNTRKRTKCKTLLAEQPCEGWVQPQKVVPKIMKVKNPACGTAGWSACPASTRPLPPSC
jgi:hypothetical protein